MGAAGKPKTGGRRPGSKNQRTREAVEILARLSYDPLRCMIELSRDPEASLELRGKMHAELARYIHPQKRAVEVSGPDRQPLTITVVREDVP